MSLFKNTEKEKKEQEVDDEDENYDPEAEVVGNWKICDLPEIPAVTGE